MRYNLIILYKKIIDDVIDDVIDDSHKKGKKTRN